MEIAFAKQVWDWLLFLLARLPEDRQRREIKLQKPSLSYPSILHY
jgi:hypothetical protein